MRKKLWTAVLAISALGLLTGLVDLTEGIAARGFGGVNYGGVLFPVLLGIWAVLRLRRERSGEDKKEDTK